MFNSNNGYSLADIAAATGGNGRNNGDGFGEGASWWIIILFLFAFNGWGGNGFGNRDNSGVGSSGGPALTRGELSADMNFSNLGQGIRGIQQGLCDGFYAMNTGMLNGFSGVDNAICNLGYNVQQGFNSTNVALMQGQNALAAQLADCCCATQGAIKDASYNTLTGLNTVSHQIADSANANGRAIERGFADTNYNLATNVCALQNSMANNTRDIIDSQNAGTRAILDYLSQEKIADLQAENQSLRLAASQAAQNTFITANQEAQTAELIRRLGRDCPVPAYVVPNPNCCYGTSLAAYNNCGCGCN